MTTLVTTFNRENKISHGRCSGCDSDLEIASKPGRGKLGFCYCTNGRCKFNRTPHKTGPSLNQGRKAKA